MQLTRIAASRSRVLLHALDLRFRLFRADIDAEPTIAYFSYSPEGWRALATKDYRRVRLLERLRVRADLRELAEFTLEFRFFFPPQQLHRLKIFPRAVR